MATATDTFHVSGIRCERCVMRLGATLRDLDGLEAANANLVGEVTLSWDDDRTDRVGADSPGSTHRCEVRGREE